MIKEFSEYVKTDRFWFRLNLAAIFGMFLMLSTLLAIGFDWL